MNFLTEQVDRGIIKKLETSLSDFGHWPDLESVNPNDPIAMQVAKQIILDAGKELIEVFVPASPRDRFETESGHIVIKRNYYDKGDISIGTGICYERENPEETDPALFTWRQVQYNPVSCFLEYEIRFVCNDTYLHREIDEIMHYTFSSRSSIKGVNEDRSDMDKSFLFIQNGTPVDLETPERIERMYRFRTDDMIISKPRVIRTGIVATKEICIGISENLESDNDSDTIIID